MIQGLYVGALLAFAVGVAHSVLGERYILTRLFRRDDLPKLFGSTVFTVRTLRFAWHLTTVAWWGFGAIILLLALQSVSFRSVSWVVAVTFLVSGAISLVASRGRHLSWVAFLAIAGACLVAAMT
jgi:hypothetical protein